jgi:methylphosphotriester-DNA--protein-cysteine methyltransferase
MKKLFAILAGVLCLGWVSVAQADFVGNKDSKVFHSEQCYLIKSMKAENKITFKTAADALKEGYTACKKCNPADVAFVGNKDSKVYHKPDCRLVAKMKSENVVNFATKDDAEKGGYKACSICLPSDKKADVTIAKADDKAAKKAKK